MPAQFNHHFIRAGNVRIINYILTRYRYQPAITCCNNYFIILKCWLDREQDDSYLMIYSSRVRFQKENYYLSITRFNIDRNLWISYRIGIEILLKYYSRLHPHLWNYSCTFHDLQKLGLLKYRISRRVSFYLSLEF